VLVNLHDRSLVSTSIAIIRGTKDGHDVSLLTPVVTFHNQLMGSANEGETIIMVKGLGDILAERVSGSSRRNSPATSVVRVRPEQIYASRRLEHTTHWTLVRNFLDSIKTANVIKSIDGRAQPAVQTKDLIFNQRSQGEVVKEIRKVFPHVCVAVLAQAFVIEPIHLAVKKMLDTCVIWRDS
jgi:hypothetical protein